MIPRTLACAWLVACATGPGAATPEPPGEGAPPTDLQRAEALAQLAIDEALALDARDLEDTYAEAMDLTDGSCPYLYGSEYWFGGCETSDGARFDGYAQALGEAGSWWGMYGQATVTRPGGRATELSGYAGWGVAPYGEVTYDYSYAYGTFHDERADAAWLAEARSVALYTQVGTDGSLYVGGSLGSLGGDVGQAADFLEVGISNGLAWGVVGVRLPEGIWIDVFFEGDEACGAAFRGDDELGDVCVDWRVR